MGRTIRVSGFPTTATADAAKRYFERITGEGSVVALKLKQFQNGVRRFVAIVQFATETLAELFLRIAGAKIWYDPHNFLKAKMMGPGADLIPAPSSYDLSLDQMELNFGCQVSEDRFQVLWKIRGIKLNSQFGLKKLCLEFHYDSVLYKMQLSYMDIWKIQLRCPRGHCWKYLLIQLFRAPKIYGNIAPNTIDHDGNPPVHSFGNIPDDQWVRSTDFTSSGCIGQSSGLCLRVPVNEKLTYFKDNFPFYEEKVGPFVLEDGKPYSSNHLLVPVIDPPIGIHLPYELLYKVNLLVQNGCLAGPNLGVRFYRLLDPQQTDISTIEFCLQKLYFQNECCYDPVSWLTKEYCNYRTSKRPPQRPAHSLDAGLVYVRRVQVTPCKVYFCDPQVNESNRVLRSYPDDIDNFLRVSFVDEDLERVHSTDLSPSRGSSSELEGGRTKIYKRILSTLRDGIVIGDKHFEFLAFSSSQLRENSLWMFASRPGLSAADIRGRLGNFSKIRNVAKYAARLGQSLSSSKESLSVRRREVEKISDVKTSSGINEYVFSDGIGKISKEFALKVAKKCFSGRKVPSAFQIRYGGYKGVVAIDPESRHKLSLRPSMLKYESNEVKLDVLAHSKYQPCYLNRQLITLLSTLGVRDEVLEEKQRKVVKQLDAILTDPAIASEALELMPPGEHTPILKEMLRCGYKPDSEPFLSMMLQNFRSSKLLELRTKTRIFIPEGRTMMGCLDETKTLDYGQVFVQASNPRDRNSSNGFSRSKKGRAFNGDRTVITGTVVVAKNPCLHPGDVRVLTAIDVPDLHHMVDCVVFPQRGKRPHPNECSGSDLDGDLYFVCWDPDLIPPLQVEPMDYTPAPPIELDHDVTIEEVQEYFANYILNDSLGIISNAHVAFADQLVGKAMSKPCIELARLFSIAVDFPKTGVPAVIPRNLHVKEFPDFMEKSDKQSYESSNVIGKLFRVVKDKPPVAISIHSFTQDVARRSYDRDMEYPGFEDYVDDAYYYKSQYDFKLRKLMHYYGIKTESEILSGNLMRASTSVNRRKEADAVSMDVKALRKEARGWFYGGARGRVDLNAKASAWYHVTYHPSYWGSYNEGLKCDHYISFAWCVYDKLIHMKKENAKERSQNFSQLCDHLSLLRM